MTAAVAESSAYALLDTAAIRERCRNIAAAVTAGHSRFFRIDRARLAAASERVANVTRRRYPDLAIPYHSRWRHFEAGGVDRRGELHRALESCSPSERARAQIDLTVISVLLDAGAGPAWGYVEVESGRRFTRSEGLAVASFRAFMQGAFSATPGDPWRVDAAALAGIDTAKLATLLQASDANPLVGLDGRSALLRRLGAALIEQHATFGADARPGALFDTLTRPSQRDTRRSRSQNDTITPDARPCAVSRGGKTDTLTRDAPPDTLTRDAPPDTLTRDASPDTLTRDGQPGTVDAPAILRALLDGLGTIWLTGSMVDGVPLGDVWRHPRAGGSGPTAGWVPFHKLTQWLAYSLFEPFEWAGVAITGRDELTGLPEYRNGGLLLDAGVLRLINDADAKIAWDVGSELVVEWRALTVALLDELAQQVRAELERPELPLACILEGGTWTAGRELAMQLRGGDPPLAIKSDGTVF